jgi:hypothetical protein
MSKGIRHEKASTLTVALVVALNSTLIMYFGQRPGCSHLPVSPWA